MDAERGGFPFWVTFFPSVAGTVSFRVCLNFVSPTPSMNRLLLLRPVSRAIRVKGNAQSTRNIARAFSTTPCQKLRSTTPVNKKFTKGMSVVDSDLFGENFEQMAEGEPLGAGF